MSKTQVSLCILTRNRVDQTEKLIESLRAFKDLELEICIADQQSDASSRKRFSDIADHITDVSDRELWDNGFGNAKQKAVRLATNDWVVIGDPNEVWHETTSMGECARLVASLRDSAQTPAFRVYFGKPRLVRSFLEGKGSVSWMDGDLGRVFNKRKMALLGYIHEAPVLKGSGQLWAEWARRRKPVAVIEHDPVVIDDVYEKRKRLLYDHLLHKIVMNPELRQGTDFHWWTAYWREKVLPRFKEITFEQWQRVGG